VRPVVVVFLDTELSELIETPDAVAAELHRFPLPLLGIAWQGLLPCLILGLSF
jgi:hypothetical protein